MDSGLSGKGEMPVKFIHLSDLHLGKRVNEFSMMEDQEYILEEILNIVDEEQPDGVINPCPPERRYSCLISF